MSLKGFIAFLATLLACIYYACKIFQDFVYPIYQSLCQELVPSWMMVSHLSDHISLALSTKCHDPVQLWLSMKLFFDYFY